MRLFKIKPFNKRNCSANFSPKKSIDMARYRLRKKMNLGAGENILNILKSIGRLMYNIIHKI